MAQTGHAAMADEKTAPAFAFAGRDFALLPVLGIFGANASGKSNVLAALDTLLGLMAGEGAKLENYQALWIGQKMLLLRPRRFGCALR